MVANCFSLIVCYIREYLIIYKIFINHMVSKSCSQLGIATKEIT